MTSALLTLLITYALPNLGPARIYPYESGFFIVPSARNRRPILWSSSPQHYATREYKEVVGDRNLGADGNTIFRTYHPGFKGRMA